MATRFRLLQSKIQYGEYYRSMKDNWIEILENFKKDNKKVVIWGGGLKGTAFLSVLDHNEYVEAVVDMNEKLQGQHLTTGHVIVGVDYIVQHEIDVVLVMNELFYVDIFFMLQKLGYKGQLIDVDYVIKHNCNIKEVLENKYHDVDLKDDKLFGYQIEEVHSKLIEILDEIDRICKKYNITYFLEAGSALGAYRYQGFLPCDDDIDVAFLRNDYDRFLKIAKKELGQQFILQYLNDGSQYFYPYAQIAINNTSFVRYDFKDVNMHLGLHIDIAPLDNVPDDVELRKKQLDRVRHITKIVRKKMLPQYFKSNSLIKKLIVNFDYYRLKFVPIGLLSWKLNNEFRKYDACDTGNVGDLCTHYKKQIVFQKDRLVPVKYMKFCNKEYPVPNDIEYYLGVMYDDYQELSPRETGSIKYNLVDVSLSRNYDGR